MRNLSSLIASALMLGCAATAQAATRDPEAVIAKTLKGRVAGQPVDCIRQTDIRSTEIVSRTAIIYKMQNGDYYLNRPDAGANFLTPNNILVTDTNINRLCGVDIVRLIDNSSRFSSGTVGLGKFIPYAKPENAR